MYRNCFVIEDGLVSKSQSLTKIEILCVSHGLINCSLIIFLSFISFYIPTAIILMQSHFIRLADYYHIIPTGQPGSNLHPSRSK